MNIKITCPIRWAAAREKASELRTNSLNDCLLRVIEFAMAKPWQIEEAKAEAEKAYATYIKWASFFDRHQDDELRPRAYNAKWRMWDKYKVVNERYHKLASGGELELTIGNDWADYSFYWTITRPDGSLWMNGGIIYSDNTQSWSIHT